MSDLLVVSELPESLVLWRVSSGVAAEVATVDVTAGFHVAVHPTLPYAYLTSGADGGSVVSVGLAGDDKGATARVTGVGGFPCHVAVSPDAALLATANYVGGTVSFIDLTDGVPTQVRSVVPLPFDAPGPDERQDACHPHMAFWRGSLLLVPDLGTDTIWTVDPASGAVSAAYQCPAGSGPRHVAADPGGRLWVALELTSEVGLLEPPPTRTAASASTVSEERSYPGDLVAAGRWIAMANRGDDTIGLYDGRGDAPRLVTDVPCGGVWPTALASDGQTLAVTHRDSDSVALFPVTDDGLGDPVLVGCTRPIAVAVLPKGI